MSRRVFPGAALGLLCSLAALGQTTGNIERRVSDSTGGALPGASIEVTSGVASRRNRLRRQGFCAQRRDSHRNGRSSAVASLSVRCGLQKP